MTITMIKTPTPSWLQLLLLLLLVGVVKGGLHIVKIVILAGLGLAGMWMLHTLAQDYNNISNNFMLGSSAGQKQLNKRSSDGASDLDIPEFPQLKWQNILSEDPEGCVPSFICQLAAIPVNQLQLNERNVLKLIRATVEKSSRANKIVRQALALGENTNISYCHKYFSKCPYTRETIMALIQTYGGA